LEDRLEVFKDLIGKEVVCEEFPDLFLGIELRTVRRKRKKGDILGDRERAVPGISIQDPYSPENGIITQCAGSYGIRSSSLRGFSGF
jgi:hypothetical protein